MKKTILTLTGAALIAASTLTLAERGNAERYVERMKEKLSLTDTQSEQVKTIMQEQHAKKQALRDETKSRVNAVLTEEQVAKLDAMRAKHEGWRDGKGHGKKGHCKKHKGDKETVAEE